MSKDNLVKTEAVLSGVRPLKDGSMNLTFSTQEMSRELMATIMTDYYNQFGWLLFSPNDINLSALPDDPAAAPVGMVSPTQKLKNTIYALYMERGAPYGKTGFDKFRSEWMEKLRSIVIQEIEKAKHESY